jgi:hypothetical protein
MIKQPPPWSKSDEDYLRGAYGILKTSEIAETLRRTAKAIRRKAAKLLLKQRNINPLDYFLNKVIYPENGCWSWRGYRDQKGYGRFYCRGLNEYAHRWSYEYFVGAVPVGLELDHLCRNRDCVNPAHLEAVTHRVNVARGISPSAKYIVLKPHS